MTDRRGALGYRDAADQREGGADRTDFLPRIDLQRMGREVLLEHSVAAVFSSAGRELAQSGARRIAAFLRPEGALVTLV